MQMSLLKLLRPLFVLLLLIPAGCAKSPSGISGSSPVSGPQLQISLTVQGTINPNLYYYILFNLNRSTGPTGSGTGAVPVVAIPYGNGFAAGGFSNYVEYHGNQGINNFGYYGIPANLLGPISLGGSQIVQTQVVGNTLTFRLPLTYLATAGDSTSTPGYVPNSSFAVEQIQTLQINFVTTNIVPPPSDTIVQKYYDTLYTAQSLSAVTPVEVPVYDVSGTTLMSGVYSNNTFDINGGSVAQYVNGVPVAVSNITLGPGNVPATDGTIDPSQVTGNTNDLQITGWTIQLTPGS
jgi:hypothetical protein